MSYLILVRHGESEWNAKGLWTGWMDIPLSDKGREEARSAGKKIKDLPIDIAYTSTLSRAQETADEILKEINKKNVQRVENKALNERDYGDYTGKNKWEIQKKVGDEEFKKIRRGYDTTIPNGESLKQVYDRVVPYFIQEILPKLKEGKNILISAHGNSLRALIKYLEEISDNEVPKLEIATGEVYIYRIGSNGEIEDKKILT